MPDPQPVSLSMCPACQRGDHANHDGRLPWEPGKVACACQGECVGVALRGQKQRLEAARKAAKVGPRRHY